MKIILVLISLVLLAVWWLGEETIPKPSSIVRAPNIRQIKPPVKVTRPSPLAAPPTARSAAKPAREQPSDEIVYERDHEITTVDAPVGINLEEEYL